MNLAGRSFLHDYRWERNPGFKVLELIMTAPMVVTNWINIQYYASTVDNKLYGSGDKLLHNVVGGDVGVFEGNGGDLRIGLPMQSIHDGERFVHTPLRLSVFIEAPRCAPHNGLAARRRRSALRVGGRPARAMRASSPRSSCRSWSEPTACSTRTTATGSATRRPR